MLCLRQRICWNLAYECDNLNFMNFKIDSFKSRKNSWILGTFKMQKIRIWPGLLQQSSVWYCWWTDATASSGPERRRTSDHRRSTARPHIACSPAAALASSLPTSSVKAGRASVQSAAWASPTVLDGRLSTRCRCRSPSTTVVFRPLRV